MLEAMAYGICCIVTPVGSVEDVIVHGENGISCCRSAIPTGLTGALLGPFCSDEEFMQLAWATVRGQTSLREYDFKDYRGKLEAIYQDRFEYCQLN